MSTGSLFVDWRLQATLLALAVVDAGSFGPFKNLLVPKSRHCNCHSEITDPASKGHLIYPAPLATGFH